MRLQNTLFMNTFSFPRLRATEGYRATENLPTLEKLLCDNLDAIALLGTTIVSFDEDEDFEEDEEFDEDFEEDEEFDDDEYDGSDEEEEDYDDEEEDYDDEEEEEDEEEDE